MFSERVEQFIEELKSHRADKERAKIRRYFKTDDADNRVIGVRMKQVFDLAKENKDMSLDEIEELLESPYYEARMGAVSVMDFQARLKSTPEDEREALFDLYLMRHDRINSWDFVDRAAPHVVGGYLYEFDQPRDVLYDLARSGDVWERRTAIVSTAYFIRKGELDDTFAIAELLLDDEHEAVQKAIGSWVRTAGKQDAQRFLDFLEEHAADMQRAALNTAINKLDPERKKHYRSLQKN